MKRAGLLVGALCLWSVAAPVHAQSLPLPDSASRIPEVAPEAPPAPPHFAHDDFFLNYAAAFSAATYRVQGNVPGPDGIDENTIADRLTGLAVRRDGVPYQQGEYAWLGGDGQGIAWFSDRQIRAAEPLGFPPSGADDPLLRPLPADTLYLLAAPLLDSRPASIASWRDPALLDSTEAIARHTNGPNGFAYTGGRFRADIGKGWEFDGRGFRVFSDGQIPNTAYDGHNLDVELRRTFGRYPSRLRFQQNRGNRFESFRWQASQYRAHHFYVLAHLDFEVAAPKPDGEWLLHLGLFHDDQKLDHPFLPERRKWYSRTYTLELSRLWTGNLSRWVKGTAAWQSLRDGVSLPDQKSGALSAGIWKTGHLFDLTATGAVATQTDYDLVWRAAAALAYHPIQTQRFVLAAGRGGAPPSALRRLLPGLVDTTGYSESGTPSASQTIHETASISWHWTTRRLDFTLMAAAGRSRHLAVWQPSGDTAALFDSYTPACLERRYSGGGATLHWHPFELLSLRGGIDHLFTNEWQSGGGPAFAPEDAWWGEIAFPMYVDRYNLHFTPRVSTRGAARGSLPDDYAVLSAGWDFRIKGLTIFWRYENLVDRNYRTGGADYAYDRHYVYGFRWEFWN